MTSSSLGAGAGEERGQGSSGFRLGGGEPGCERRLADTGVGDQPEELGGVREDRRGEQAGGFLPGRRITVVPEVRGQGAGAPGVDVVLDVPAGAAGELVAYGFVALPRLRS